MEIFIDIHLKNMGMKEVHVYKLNLLHCEMYMHVAVY